MPHGMTQAQFNVLNHCVRLGDGKAPAQLASAFQVTRGTMTSTLQKLQEKGMIHICADESDGRAKKVFLTAEGRAARAEALKALQPQLSRLAKALDLAGIHDTLPVLENLRVWLDTHRS
jgi:DNA-binding MarR family transcriptional regulator